MAKVQEYNKFIAALVGVIVWILAGQGVIIPDAVQGNLIDILVTGGPLIIPILVYYIPNIKAPISPPPPAVAPENAEQQAPGGD